MAFDGIAVSALAGELGRVLTGGYISKISEPEKDELMLAIKTREYGQVRLLASAGASLPFLYLTKENKPSPPVAPAFTMLLRKHLQGGRILSVIQPSMERILRINVEHRNEMGDLHTLTLIVELMGKHSNIIFVDPGDTIIDSMKRIPCTVSSVREVLPGRPYFIPKAEGKLDPALEIAKEVFIEALSKCPGDMSRALYTAVTGFSPASASELLYRAGIDAQVPAKALSGEDWNRLYSVFCSALDEIHEGRFAPCIVYDGEKPVDVCAYVPLQQRDLKISRHDSISEALETFYAEKDRYTRTRQRTADLRKIVSTALERTSKKLDLQLKQLSDTDRMDQYRLYGELINTYGYGVEEGAASFEAENFYTGEMVTVPLDPEHSVHENANRYFERFQKLKRTRLAVGKQIEETKMALMHLKSVQASLEIASGEGELKQIAAELSEAGYMKRNPSQKKSREGSSPFHYISSDGFDIYVGKNNYQNDEITFKMSDGGDWWFHSKKFPGSHVLLKAGGAKEQDIPDRAFNEAGRLAAFYSAGKGQEKVEIDYTQKKNVKKPGGAAPGFVVYYTNYSMAIQPDITGIRLAE